MRAETGTAVATSARSWTGVVPVLAADRVVALGGAVPRRFATTVLATGAAFSLTPLKS